MSATSDGPNDLHDSSQTNQAKTAISCDELLDIFESISDNILVLYQNWTIGYVNSNQAKVFGYSPSEMIGKNFWQLLPDLIGTEIEKNLREVMQTKQANCVELTSAYKGRFFELNIIPTANRLIVYTKDITKHKQAEKAMLESEQRYRTLINNSLDAIVVHKEGKFIYANPSALSLFGAKSFDELKDRNIFDFMVIDEQKNIHARSEQAKASKKLAPKEEKIVRLDGSQFFVETIGAPVYYNNDWAMLVILRNITKRKTAEEELKQTSERFSKAFYHSPAALFISRLIDGYLVDVNASFLKIFEYQYNEVIGHTTLELDIYPEPSKRDEIVRILQTQPSLHNFEITVRTKAGKYVTVAASMDKIILNEQEHIVGTFIDITEQKKLREQLELYTKNLEKIIEERTEKIRQSEQSYRELYESFGEAFIAVDWELNVIHWNKAAERVTTTAAEDALGKKIYEVLPEMMTVNIEPYYEALASKKSARFMMNVTSRQTGKPSVFEISTYPSTLGIIIIVEDKTQEEQNKRLSTIGQVAGMVGHDIRNPLQAINSELYLIREAITHVPDVPSKAEALEGVNFIQEQVYYINKIVSDLQDYAKPLRPELGGVDICQLIAEPFKIIKLSKNIKVSVSCEKDVPKLMLDSTFMRRILANLVTNAIQAMPNGGKLSVKAFRKDKQVFITVKDTGIGIPKDMYDKIFQPMFTTKSKGQGFGLAVVKRMIEAQGGTISVESKEGKGAKFIIRLPISERKQV